MICLPPLPSANPTGLWSTQVVQCKYYSLLLVGSGLSLVAGDYSASADHTPQILHTNELIKLLHPYEIAQVRSPLSALVSTILIFQAKGQITYFLILNDLSTSEDQGFSTVFPKSHDQF